MTEPCAKHEAVLVEIRGLRQELERYSVNQAEIVKGQHELRERITIAEQSTKSAHHRLDNMEDQTKAIIRMSMSVEQMSEQMKELIDLFKGLDGRVDILERAPGETVLSYWKLFVGALATGAGGVFLGMILK